MPFLKEVFMKIKNIFQYINFKIIMIFIIIIFLIFLFKIYWVSNNIIYPNIKISEIEVGGLTKDQARIKLKQLIQHNKKEKSLIFCYQGEKWKVPYKNFKHQYDIEKTIDRVYYLGKNGNFLNRIRNYFYFKNREINVPLETIIDSTEIEKIIKQLAQEINIQEEDAKIQLKDGKINILPQKKGRRLEEKKLEKMIEEHLQFFNQEWIQLPVKETFPKITQQDLNSINGKIASFSTYFNSQKKQRVENLRVASRKIDGKILLPGEILSVNKSIGPITKENGYKDAPVIVNGKLQTDIGGGVCQVSTTLYNAAVRANLQIVERQHHSMPVSYVPLGQDAAIAGNWKDLKIKNNLDESVYIEMYLKGNQLIANLYSNQDFKQEIDLETELVSTISPEVIYKKDFSKNISYKKVEQEGKKGYRVHVYKIWYKNGKVKKRQLLHKDYYPPVDRIMIIGQKKEGIEEY